MCSLFEVEQLHNASDTFVSVMMMDGQIRVCVFLLAGFYTGLPALGWVLCSTRLSSQVLSGRVSAFVLSLLLVDLLELVLSHLVAQQILRGEFCQWGHFDWWKLCTLFFGVRLCGLYFHQLVALESVLSLTGPHCCWRLLSAPPCSLPLCLALWLGLQFYVGLFKTHLSQVYPSFIITLTLCVLPLILPVLICLLMCSTSHRPVGSQRRRPGPVIPAVAMVTAYILYAPCLTLVCVASYLIPSLCSHPYSLVPEAMWEMAFAMMSLRLAMDPLLCVLVIRKAAGGHQESVGDTEAMLH